MDGDEAVAVLEPFLEKWTGLARSLGPVCSDAQAPVPGKGAGEREIRVEIRVKGSGRNLNSSLDGSSGCARKTHQIFNDTF